MDDPPTIRKTEWKNSHRMFYSRSSCAFFFYLFFSSSSAKQSKWKKKKKKSETKALFNEGMCDSLNINYIFKTHQPYRISKKYDILLCLLYFWTPVQIFGISFVFHSRFLFLHSIFIHNILFLYIDNRIIVMSFRWYIIYM